MWGDNEFSPGEFMWGDNEFSPSKDYVLHSIDEHKIFSDDCNMYTAEVRSLACSSTLITV